MTHILNPRLIADVFDEDVIIANLDTGTFQDSSKVFNEIASKFQENSIEIVIELNECFKNMQDEEVIIVVDSEGKSKKVTLKEPLKYIKSEFLTYTDLQELLLLDPIHEIDEDEWQISDDKK
jgi:c-di-AMP phosphodiesterase-like protein